MSDRIIKGIDSSGNEVAYLITGDRYLPVQITALDTETTSTVIQVACNAAGHLYSTLSFDGDLTVSMGDVEKLLAKQYYKRTLFYEHASGRVKYKCQNTDIGAAVADTDWFIWLLSDADSPTIEGPRTGRVDSEGNIDGDHSWET